MNLSSPLVRHLIPTAMIGAVSWFSSQVALSQEDPSSGFEATAPSNDDVSGGEVEASANSDLFGTEAEVASSEVTSSEGSEAPANGSDQYSEESKEGSKASKPSKKAKAKRHRLAKKKSRKHVKKAEVVEEAPVAAKVDDSQPASEVKESKVPAAATAETKTPEVKSVESKAPESTTTLSAPALSTPAVATTPGATVADGSSLNLDALGMSITPPKGWEVQTQGGSLSVVMREPAVANAQPGQTKYQRNITIATIHKASPIDEKRAEDLKADLMRTFGKDGSLSDFKVGEHKFFNFHGTNDGLLVYSTMNLGEYPMMQMHVLVSGEDKQFLLTYTDLASQFGAEKDSAYAAAWDSMVSIQVKGQAPTRFDLYKNHLIAGGTGLFLFLVGWILRRRAANMDFKGEADALIDSEDSLVIDASRAPKTMATQVSEAAAPLSAAPASSTSNFSFISSF